jgi:hypothetical protein
MYTIYINVYICILGECLPFFVSVAYLHGGVSLQKSIELKTGRQSSDPRRGMAGFWIESRCATTKA